MSMTVISVGYYKVPWDITYLIACSVLVVFPSLKKTTTEAIKSNNQTTREIVEAQGLKKLVITAAEYLRQLIRQRKPHSSVPGNCGCGDKFSDDIIV